MLRQQNNYFSFAKSFLCLLFLCVLLNANTANASTSTQKNEETNPTIEKSEENEKRTPVFFKIEENSKSNTMARKALGESLTNAEIEVGRHIPLGIARVDLNDDGIHELFIRVLDQKIFCQQDDCQIYGFAITQDGFIKIADFQARTIDVKDSKTQGTKDLLVRMHSSETKNYKWSGKSYEEVQN